MGGNIFLNIRPDGGCDLEIKSFKVGYNWCGGGVYKFLIEIWVHSTYYINIKIRAI